MKTIGTIPVRDKAGKIVDRKAYATNFVFPKTTFIKTESQIAEVHARVDYVNKCWDIFKLQAGVSDLGIQLKDLRTYFNHKLKSQYGFTSKEAGAYIGNSEEINNQHYTPVSEDVIREKMRRMEFLEKKVGCY